MHIDFLKQVLMSNAEYWIVAKKDWVREYGGDRRLPDQIMFISIPQNIRRGLMPDEILLNDIEKLHRSEIVCNIFINSDYPPFQFGQTLSNVYMGYPVTSNIKQFVIDALQLKSDSIYDYAELLKPQTQTA